MQIARKRNPSCIAQPEKCKVVRFMSILGWATGDIQHENPFRIGRLRTSKNRQQYRNPFIHLPNQRSVRSFGLCPSWLGQPETSIMRTHSASDDCNKRRHGASEVPAISMQLPSEFQELSTMSSCVVLPHLVSSLV